MPTTNTTDSPQAPVQARTARAKGGLGTVTTVEITQGPTIVVESKVTANPVTKLLLSLWNFFR